MKMIAEAAKGVVFEKGDLKNFATFTGKHLRQSLQNLQNQVVIRYKFFMKNDPQKTIYFNLLAYFMTLEH